MAREINNAAVGDWVTYKPDIDDNIDDPTGVTVELHPLNASEVREYQRGMIPTKPKKGRVQFDPMASAHKMNERIFKERVRNVRNYAIGGSPIVTGEELYVRGEVAFVDDVLAALFDLSKLSAGALGKSTSPSASSQAGMKPSSGGAVDGAAGEKTPSSPSPSGVSLETATEKAPQVSV